MLKRFKKNKFRDFTKLYTNKNGELSTELIRPCTNFISARRDVKDIIFTKRCRVVKHENLVKLSEAYFKNEIHKKESISVYINGDVATINFFCNKITVNLNNFNPFDSVFKNVKRSHLIKIYKEKNILQLRKEAEMEKQMDEKLPNVIRLVQ